MVFSFKVTIFSLLVSNVEDKLVIIDGDMSPAVLPLSFEAITKRSPACKDEASLTRFQPPSSDIEGVIVTLQVAVLPLPSVAAAVIVTFPWLTAMTWPLELTTATPELEDVQSRILLVAEVGEIVGFSVTSSPTLNVAEAGLILKFEIKTTASDQLH